MCARVSETVAQIARPDRARPVTKSAPGAPGAQTRPVRLSVTASAASVPETTTLRWSVSAVTSAGGAPSFGRRFPRASSLKSATTTPVGPSPTTRGSMRAAPRGIMNSETTASPGFAERDPYAQLITFPFASRRITLSE